MEQAPTVDTATKTRTNTVQLFKKLKESRPSDTESVVRLNRNEFEALYQLSKQAARDEARHRRDTELLAVKNQCEQDLLRAELRAESVDREANAARTVERQRVLFERITMPEGTLRAFDRAAASAGHVEAALASLSPVQPSRSEGSAVLHSNSRQGTVD